MIVLHSKTSEISTEALPAAKDVLEIRSAPRGHWVGDGFPVRTVFAYDNAQAVSPFLLLDYAGPYNFPPAEKRRGVGEHPHRGFETVTIVYSGEVEHRDSGGGGGSHPLRQARSNSRTSIMWRRMSTICLWPRAANSSAKGRA